MVMGKGKAASVSFLLVGVVVVIFLEERALRSVCIELADTKTELAKTTGDLASLRQEFADLRAQGLQRTGAPSSGQDFTRDIAKLRAEISELRGRAHELEQSKPGPKEPEPLIYADSVRREDYKFGGFDSPQGAFQSQLWAIHTLDPKAYLASLAPGPVLDMFTKQFANLPDGVMPGGFKNGSMYRATGFRVVEETAVSENEVRLKVFLEGQNMTLQPILKKIGNEWKWSGNYHEP
jgi:hypothetical protein